MYWVIVEAKPVPLRRRDNRAYPILLVSYALPTPKTKKRDFQKGAVCCIGSRLRCRSPKKNKKTKEITGVQLQ